MVSYGLLVGKSGIEATIRGINVKYEKPHILISYNEGMSPEIPKLIVDTVQHPNLNLVEEAREDHGPFAGTEWLMLTAIAIYVTKPYFEAFLKEMGKDHYNLLKKGILSVWNKLFDKNRQIRLLLVGTEGKIKSGNKYSLGFSVWSEMNDGHKVKFLFEDELTEDEFEKNVSLILQLLQAIHLAEGRLDDCLIMDKDVRHSGRTILIAFDKEAQKLRMISPLLGKKKHNI